MRFLRSFLKQISANRAWKKAMRRFLIGCSGAIVFITIYLLILPAVAVDHDTADDMPGVYLEDGTGEAQALTASPEDGSFADASYEQDASEDGFATAAQPSESAVLEENTNLDIATEEVWNDTPVADDGAEVSGPVENAVELQTEDGADSDFTDEPAEDWNETVEGDASLYEAYDEQGSADVLDGAPVEAGTEAWDDSWIDEGDGEGDQDLADVWSDDLVDNPVDDDSDLYSDTDYEYTYDDSGDADDEWNQPETVNELTAEAGTSVVRVLFDDASAIPYGSFLNVTEYHPSVPEEAAFYDGYVNFADQSILLEDPDWSRSDARLLQLSIIGPDGSRIIPSTRMIVYIDFSEFDAVRCSTMQAVQFVLNEENEPVSRPIPVILEEDFEGAVTGCSFEFAADELSLFSILWDAEDADASGTPDDAGAYADDAYDDYAEDGSVETGAEEGEPADEYDVENGEAGVYDEDDGEAGVYDEAGEYDAENGEAGVYDEDDGEAGAYDEAGEYDAENGEAGLIDEANGEAGVNDEVNSESGEYAEGNDSGVEEAEESGSEAASSEDGVEDSDAGDAYAEDAEPEEDATDGESVESVAEGEDTATAESAESDAEGEDAEDTESEAVLNTDEETDSEETESTSEEAETISKDKEKADSDQDDEKKADDKEKSLDYPAQVFSEKTDALKVQVYAEEGAFPAGTYMTVKEVKDEETLDEISESVEKQVARVHAVDITFFNAEDVEIEPLKPIRVVMSAEESSHNEEIQVVHVDDEGNAAAVDDVTLVERNGVARAQIIETGAENQDPDADSSLEAEEDSEEIADVIADDVTLEDDTLAEEDAEAADEYLADGATEDVDEAFEKVIADSISEEVSEGAEDETEPEEAFADSEESFADPVAVYEEPEYDLAIEDDEADRSVVLFDADQFSIYALVYTVDFHWEVDGKTYEFSLPGGGYVSLETLVEILGVSGGDALEEYTEAHGSDEDVAADAHTNPTVLTADIPISEETKKFVEEIEKVEFSDPKLVWVGKNDSIRTVGELKEANELQIEYSSDLTEEQIAEINAQTVEAGDWALISMRAFDTEESLTVTMGDGEIFTIRVTDAQIRKAVIDAKGATWEITVTYGDDAQIPESAELKVEEILPEDERYQEYYEKSVEKADAGYTDKEVLADDSAENHALAENYAHVFDIQIWSGDEKIEPSAKVTVNIRLLDAPEEENKDLQVVHFGKDGPEVMELIGAGSQHTEEGKTELRFETNEFSVYTVVSVTDLSKLVENGPYALIGQEGRTIRSTDGDTIVSNYAMVSDADGTALVGKGVNMDDSTSPATVGGSVTEWGFESAGNGQYYIYTIVGNSKQYIYTDNQFHYGNTQRKLMMTDSASAATKFTVEASGGKLKFKDPNGWYITENPYTTTIDNSVDYGRNVQRCNFVLMNNQYSNNTLFTLGKVDPNYEEKAARKVSAADWKAAAAEGKWDESDTIVIYRRIIQADGSEKLFALATDGSLVPVSDGGDSIYYHTGDKNVNWHITYSELGYVIASVPTEGSDEPVVYLSPSVTDNTWMSDSPVGLTMTGLGSEYGTAIEKWDQTQYAYAGLHVDAANVAGGITPGSGKTSDTFLFAVSKTLISQGTLHTVDTVDSASKGITLKIFNYGGNTGHYGYRNTDMQSVMGDDMTQDDWDTLKSHVKRTVTGKLGEDGYPVSLTEGKGSYENLFKLKDDGGVATFVGDANNLFLQSYYDENGMFRYSSMENFAHYNADTGKFEVYREAGTPYLPSDNAHYYYYHGHFMPFNTLNPDLSVSRLVDQYGKSTNKDEGRSYESVYGLNEIPDYYVGMTMEANFVQPREGTLENGDPVVYRFTGDDDLLVYIDDILVLDVGGIHEPLTGSINFETGVVTQPNFFSGEGYGEGWKHHTTTLYEIFSKAHDDGRISDADWAKMKWKEVNGQPATFADYTSHSFNMFYFERGAGASNLDLAFNLQVIKKNEFSVTKELPEEVDDRFANQQFRFRATYMDGNVEKPLYPGAKNAAGKEVCTKVVYKNQRDADGRPKTVSVDNEGYFTLYAGETAEFTMSDETIKYNIREVDLDQYNLEKVTIDGGTAEHVEINDVQASIVDNAAPAGSEAVEDRSMLIYTNYPKTQDLRITKHIVSGDSSKQWKDDIISQDLDFEYEDTDVFEFRVYLESTVEVDGEQIQQLIPYSYGPYYVTKMVDGQLHYFTLTGTNNKPEDKGTTKVVCSTTGRSGSINSIPPEYTVVIPELSVGTHFYIEERRDNLPEGYAYVGEELKPGTYDTASITNINRILARDEKDYQTFDENTVGKIKLDVDAESDVYNKKIHVQVEKQWLKMDGGSYTAAEVVNLPDSDKAVVKAELWKVKTDEENSVVVDEPVTVTFMVNIIDGNGVESEYRQVEYDPSVLTVKKGSDLEFSLGARGTSRVHIDADTERISASPNATIDRQSITSTPNSITYSNGRTKEKWSKYILRDVQENTIVYATFDADKVGDDFVGLYIASMEEVGSSTGSTRQKVADIELKDGHWTTDEIPAEWGCTYYLQNVTEEGLPTNRYTFNSAPEVVNENGNITLKVSNTYRAPIDVTVEKKWEPELSTSEEANAYVEVELHRYVKKTLGVLEVVLQDTSDIHASVVGAEFKLQKLENGEYVDTEYQHVLTDANGKAGYNDLVPGTYKMVQVQTPTGYSMNGQKTETDPFEVKDEQTVKQEYTETLFNTALITAGSLTVSVTDGRNNLKGATFTLYMNEQPLYTGLESSSDGTINVGNLKPASYYVVQNEAPTGYRLPANTRVGEFVVEENRPGEDQHTDISVVNEPRPSGTVSVTLKKADNNQPISDATIELRQGNTVIDSGKTDNSGVVSFGVILYDGDQVTVHQVDTGSAGADYRLADDVSTAINDQDGLNQIVAVTLEDTPKGKGTITVTLKKDSGDAISGAQFELKQGNDVVATAVTNSSGVAEFQNVYEGSYTVHQVDTGSAGSDYEVDDDQTVAIDNNGGAAQQETLEFVNEEANGHVTIKLWAKGGTGQWNWALLNTYSDLKPGKVYSFTATANPGLYPSNIWYYQDTSDHKNGDNISSDSCIPIDTTEQWINGTYHFVIEPTQDYTTYSFVLISGWGVNDIFSMSMDAAVDNNSAGPFISMSSPRFTRFSTLRIPSNSNAIGEEQTNSRDEAAGFANNANESDNTEPVTMSSSTEPPEGYMVDSFVEPYVIRQADDWKHTFDDLDKYDPNGELYYYYVEEKECHPDSYHLKACSTDTLSETGTILMTNAIDKGSLIVTKAVKLNGSDYTDHDALTFYVGLFESENATTALSNTVKAITVGSGSLTGTVQYDDLTVGEQYYVFETDANGNKLAQNSKHNGYYVVDNGGQSDAIEVSPAASIGVENEKRTGDLELTKEVTGSGADDTKEFSFTIELEAPAGEILDASYKYTKSGSVGEQTLTLDRTDDNTKATISGILLKHNDVYTILGLPDGTKYSVFEEDYSHEGYSPSYDPSSSGTIIGGASQKSTVAATNSYEPGLLIVEKEIDGNAKNEDDVFEFLLQVDSGSNSNGKAGSYTIEGVKKDFSYKNGVASEKFELKGGQKAEFLINKKDAAFTLREISANTRGYRTSVTATGATSSGNMVTGTVSKNSNVAVTVTYKNTKDETEAQETKAWMSGTQSITWPEDVQSVTFTLFKSVNGADETVVTKADVNDYWEDPDAFENGIEVTSANHTASWEHLPAYYWLDAIEADPSNNIEGREAGWYQAKYSVKETKVVLIDGTVFEGDAIEGTFDPKNETNTITNKLSDTEIGGTKVWVDQNEHNAELNASNVQLKLWRTTEDTIATTTDWVPVSDKEPTWDGNHYSFTSLDKYDAAGNLYTYRVTEEPLQDYETEYTDNKDYALDNEEIINTELTTVSAKKTWGSSDTWPEGMSVTFELKQFKNDSEQTGFATTETDNGHETTVTISNQQTIEWDHLPKYYLDGGNIRAYTYKVYETGMAFKAQDASEPTPIEDYRQYYSVTGEGEGTDGLVVIDNTPVTIALSVTKVWTLNGAAKSMEEGDSITFELHQSGVDEALPLSLENTSVNVGEPALGQVKYVDGEWQIVTISGLAKYRLNPETGFEHISYYVVETGVTGDTKITYKKDSGAEGAASAQAANEDAAITIYNKDYSIDIGIIKIDETTREAATQKKLPEAKFTLHKLSGELYTKYPDESSAEKTTDENGTLSFTGLPDGKYRIDETKTPDGYVYKEKVEIYFTIENGVVKWTDSTGAETTSQNLVTYEAADKTFTVGNEPGEPLPNAGGPGTKLFTILGSILIAGAGLLLWRRKRIL